MTRLSLLFIAGLVAAAPAAAQPFPTRSGDVGVLDVPDAETLGIGGAGLAAELRVDRVAGQPIEGGPLPLSLTAGIADDLDVGLYMREWGQPGDPLPARMVFGGRAKLQLLPPAASFPGIAVGVGVDRVNGIQVVDGRVVASTASLGLLRFLAFLGAEAERRELSGIRPTFGGALTAALWPHAQLAVEALGGPRGANLGLGVRWLLRPQLGVSLSANYFPGDDAARVSFGIAYGIAVRRQTGQATVMVQPTEAPEQEPQRKISREDRPRFRLRMALASPERLGEPRRLQHGPWTPSALAASAGPAKAVSAPAKGAAPSLDDLAEAKLREQEALADARERRVRATGDQLDGREKAALEEAKKLEHRARELTSREQQLDLREQRIPKAGLSGQQRELASLEAQLSAQERQLSAQVRSYAPAVEAAQGRERDAASREETERQERSRLAASVTGAPSRSQQLELRKQALAARSRQLAAMEARLVAKGERIDAMERQLRTKSDWLDAWARRLDTRAERLDAIEKRAATPTPQPVPLPKPAETKAASESKDKAVFVMVVKSPTAIVKERGAGASRQGDTGLHAGVAVEKAVAAATVVAFPSPSTTLSELDGETIDNIAKLAAKEHCEILIWARAKDPSLMAEAQRRASELKVRVMRVGPVAESQVVTRITTRPGAQGVDVVVSALRESANPAPTPATAPRGTPGLETGEGGKRQIREAVQTAQPSIEACVGQTMEQKRLQRAEVALKVTISAQGRAVKLAIVGEDLAGTNLEECLKAASAGWAFPSSDADYVIDVPISIFRGGDAR